jgi:class 3 adenylate cyclase
VPSCTSCGEENPERARFCHACGEPLEEESSERFRRTVTILFSDVVDSTGLGERLDPETLSYVLTDYFEGVKPVVERHGGTLAKFIGDAVMAVYGLTELHALRRYERKEVLPAAARARALLEELAPRVAEETPA